MLRELDYEIYDNASFIAYSIYYLDLYAEITSAYKGRYSKSLEAIRSEMRKWPVKNAVLRSALFSHASIMRLLTNRPEFSACLFAQSWASGGYSAEALDRASCEIENVLREKKDNPP